MVNAGGQNLGLLFGPLEVHSLSDVRTQQFGYQFLYNYVHALDTVISTCMRLSFLGKYNL